VVLAGLVQASAMLFHELAILFLPVALFRLRKRPRAMLTYAATALIPVAAAYLGAYAALSRRMALRGFFSWVTSHAPDSGFFFNPLGDALLSIRGTLRLLFGGKLGDLVNDGISKAALAVLAIATVFFLIGLWRTLRKSTVIARPPLHLFVWVGVYVAFLFVWMPQNTFYRLFYLPPLIAMLASMLRDAPLARRALWLFVPVLMAWNFCFVVYPQSRPDFNMPLRFALTQHRAWKPGTPIVFCGFYPDLWIISYFNQQASWAGIDHADIAAVERELAYARTQNTPLWLEEAAYRALAADPDGRKWLAGHERPGELMESRDEKHDFRFHCIR
jgi:hypothetical protein